MTGYVFDSGALIALERRSSALTSLLSDVVAGRNDVVVPRTVIAQVWRGGPRQASVSRLVRLASERGPVTVDELSEERARQIGRAIGRTGHVDIVDVHVALTAAELSYAVVTSDPDDIARVDPDLVVVRI